MVDVNDVVRDTLALRRTSSGSATSSVIDALAAGLPHVFADPHQLQQVLLNLVINAEQAMTDRRRPRDAGRPHLARRGARRRAARSQRRRAGLPPEVQPQIFDPFFTTKEVGQGTGLGLTVAYAIVQEHGGAITVESAPGEGASFRWSCRRGDEAREAARSGGRRYRREPSGSRAAVLLVEDEPAPGAAVVECAGGRRLCRDRAGDGEEALDAIARRTFDADHLRPEDAAAGRPGVLPRRSSALPGAGAAGDLRDRRRRRHRRGALPRRERLPLARQALPARRLAAGRARRDSGRAPTTPGAAPSARSTAWPFGLRASGRNCERPCSASTRPAPGASSPPSAFCRRWMARAWSWETRDSLTPISAPICFIVTSP